MWIHVINKYLPIFTPKITTLKYIDQGWMENLPLYAVCNL